MKRKLNDKDVPEEVPAVGAAFRGVEAFERMQLDPRLLQGIVKENFAKPTAVQAKAIPLALEGKDILARSKTGSGKTAAYVLPILQTILQRKSTSPTVEKSTSALILVPTRELAGQVTKAIETFTAFCAQDVRAENLTRKEDERVQRARLADRPDILVATPGRIATLLKSSALELDKLSHLVIDEADLILSYGYDEDLEHLAEAIPKGVQTFLMSATLKAEISKLKGLFCRDPVMLELEDEEKSDTTGKVTQYVVRCGEDEKFLLLYAIFKLKLITGKTIIFVGDVDRCYLVKLFLEQFGIKSCVLNSELPVNSRIHVVEEFSRGVYDIIIAADEDEIIGNEEDGKEKGKKDKKRKTQNGDDAAESVEEEGEKGSEDPAEEKNVPPSAEADAGADAEAEAQLSRKKRRKESHKQRPRDTDYGVSRGIDFRSVACVLNFDLPLTSKSYTHRIGRTGRAGRSGIALSFVIPTDLYRKNKVDKNISFTPTENDEKILVKITKSQSKKGHELQPYAFDMAKLEGFRYRLSSALQHVTPGAVRAARLKELKNELIKSEKLKRHFEENPEELRQLRHDGELRSARVLPHLRHVPEYLLPNGAAQQQQQGSGSNGFVPLYKREDDRRRRGGKTRGGGSGRGRGRMGGAGTGRKRPGNPLKTFKGKR